MISVLDKNILLEKTCTSVQHNGMKSTKIKTNVEFGCKWKIKGRNVDELKSVLQYKCAFLASLEYLVKKRYIKKMLIWKKWNIQKSYLIKKENIRNGGETKLPYKLAGEGMWSKYTYIWSSRSNPTLQYKYITQIIFYT